MTASGRTTRVATCSCSNRVYQKDSGARCRPSVALCADTSRWPPVSESGPERRRAAKRSGLPDSVLAIRLATDRPRSAALRGTAPLGVCVAVDVTSTLQTSGAPPATMCRCAQQSPHQKPKSSAAAFDFSARSVHGPKTSSRPRPRWTAPTWRVSKSAFRASVQDFTLRIGGRIEMMHFRATLPAECLPYP
jgi:hypothetical protein